MGHQDTIQRATPAATTAGMDHSEELLAEVDEPPDERQSRTTWAPPKLQSNPSFNKADPRIYERRESLLTRQLHSETEQTDEEEQASRAPPRTLSTQSTWSNPSIASTAELTSDDSHSVASPATSPPLPPTTFTSAITIAEKHLSKEPKILSQEEKLAEPGSEQSVEAGLGRKRCISFACGNKAKAAPTAPPKPSAAEAKAVESSSPPKRKCTIKFACATKAGATRPAAERTVSGKRLASPPPPENRLTKVETATKVHRGSDSTVTHVSPKNTRKESPSSSVAVAVPITVPTFAIRRRLSNDSQASTEATRFHEFASSEDEPEEWVQESTCYKSRLTVNDTLQKEITIRKACEEVEEEVLEEEEEDEDEDEEAEEDDVDEDEDEDDDDDIEAEEESDDGFKTDDEDGFAESDSEGEESDEDWWRPGGRSTAATSVEHLDRANIPKMRDTSVLASSVGSASSSHITPSALLKKARNRPHANGVNIKSRSDQVDLPDSTDFVCGTLDEDRPLEQAFLNHKKEREAARHKARPQDIDPSFPTSDPDMDEEDDEDLEDPEESEQESFMHGNLDDLDDEQSTLRRRPSAREQRPSRVHRSPPPPARHRSPAPGVLKRQPTARSPPPPTRHRSPPPPARHRSPAPGQLKRTGTARSPPPRADRRGTGRSPTPRKLFANSPKRDRSAAPLSRMTSPPNTRRASPATGTAAGTTPNVLASRPQLTHTASLPRAGGFLMGQLNGVSMDDGDETETGESQATEQHKRGAIDIYKGLVKKRDHRKQKLYQKACAKAAAKGEKPFKVKPGKGAERMREVGLELQKYRGKGEHILSM